MIYIEEKDFKRQIELLNFLASFIDFRICAWLYPESSANELAGFIVIENPTKLSPVTTYSDWFEPKCTSPAQATNKNISAFGSALSTLKQNCDSLALYKNNESSWFAATIGHEGMCLIQDDSLLTSLIESGFNASTSAPAWW